MSRLESLLSLMFGPAHGPAAPVQGEIVDFDDLKTAWPG
jgi:hypothetical protein